MVITFFWKEKVEIRNLPELQAQVQKHGGSIIRYQRILSVLVLTRTYSEFEWVAPSASRRRAGSKHAIFCLLLGWWSIGGWMFTPVLIVNNLLGGIDVTKLLIPQPPPLPGQNADTTAIDEYNRSVKRQQWVMVGVLVTMLLLVILFLVLPAIKKFA